MREMVALTADRAPNGQRRRYRAACKADSGIVYGGKVDPETVQLDERI